MNLKFGFICLQKVYSIFSGYITYNFLQTKHLTIDFLPKNGIQIHNFLVLSLISLVIKEKKMVTDDSKRKLLKKSLLSGKSRCLIFAKMMSIE